MFRANSRDFAQRIFLSTSRASANALLKCANAPDHDGFRSLRLYMRTTPCIKHRSLVRTANGSFFACRLTRNRREFDYQSVEKESEKMAKIYGRDIFEFLRDATREFHRTIETSLPLSLSPSLALSFSVWQCLHVTTVTVVIRMQSSMGSLNPERTPGARSFNGMSIKT